MDEDLRLQLLDIARAPRWELPDPNPMLATSPGLNWVAIPKEFMEKLDRLVAGQPR